DAYLVQRKGDDDAGTVFARRAVHDRRAGGVRDESQCRDDRVRPVIEVAQVHIGRAAPVLPHITPVLPRQDGRALLLRGDDVGTLARFGEQRQVHDADPRLVSQRSGAFEIDLGLGTQIRYGAHVVLVDEPLDIPGRQLLQIVRADQPAGTHRPVVCGQSTQISGIRDSVQVNPMRIHLFHSNSCHPAALGRFRLSMIVPQGNGGACYGDSGGPNFVTIDGTLVLAATTITGDTPCYATNVSFRTDTPTARTSLAPYVALS